MKNQINKKFSDLNFFRHSSGRAKHKGWIIEMLFTVAITNFNPRIRNNKFFDGTSDGKKFSKTSNRWTGSQRFMRRRNPLDNNGEIPKYSKKIKPNRKMSHELHY